jgi:predicted amidohydrolase YtcJ
MSEDSAVDLILYNGKIYIKYELDDVTEALAIRGDKIVAVGTADRIRNSYTSDSAVDLGGKTVIPGFTDAHAHMLDLGLSMMMMDLVDADSADEIADGVRRQVQNSDKREWILGRGWNQNRWPGREFPHHLTLDRVAPDNPVFLTRIDSHAAWVNNRALALAGLNRDTADPDGGRIIRDAEGNPTGVLIDAAMSLVARHIPEPDKRQKRKALLLAIDECLSYGITTVHDMGMDLGTIDIYRDIIRSGDAAFRLYAAIDGTGKTWDHFLHEGRVIGQYRNMLTVRAIKLFSDGALGSRGAALIEPYSDDSGNDGLILKTEDEIYDITVQALENGFQVCTHAIGDRGNRIVLNAYERALRHVPVSDHRLRVEHAQVVHENDFKRFYKYRIIPSMQPIHCTSDMYWAVDRLGTDRARGAYAWKTFIAQGSLVAGGSDFPIEPVNPLLGIFSSVTRQNKYLQPDGGWYPDQRIHREEAVKMFTLWAAYAAFEEDIKGTLEPGKLADLVIYPEDPIEGDISGLLTIRPDKTILGGKVVFDRSAGDVTR